jgi:hypothetical protein
MSSANDPRQVLEVDPVHDRIRRHDPEGSNPRWPQRRKAWAYALAALELALGVDAEGSRVPGIDLHRVVDHEPRPAPAGLILAGSPPIAAIASHRREVRPPRGPREVLHQHALG